MGKKPKRKGISVRWLLLAVSSLILLFPIFAVFALRVYQNHLVGQTERSLIAQSVLIGELWRTSWLEEQALDQSKSPEVRPSDRSDDKYVPIDPVIDLSRGIEPPMTDPQTHREGDDLSWRAGQKINGTLQRAQIFNLSSGNVLGTDGCAVAASGPWLGACFDYLPEVQTALNGKYHAIPRRRIMDEPKPSFSSISRGGDIRVFSATPVFSDGKVIAVVWMSRTSMAPIKAAWLYRRPLLIGLALSVFLAALISLFLAWTITRPLRRITEAAHKVAQGQLGRLQTPRGFAPAEVHILSDALRSMTTQLSERAEYISEFAANASHELKSPITAIRGAAELLREELDDMPPEQRERFLKNIESDASRMESIVTRLLELARIENAPELFREIEPVSFFKEIASHYLSQIQFKSDGDLPTFQANPEQLESAIRNLLDNAVRHDPQSKAQLKVQSNNTHVQIGVTDNGEGVSEANRSRLFQRFFTTERDKGGTGLGLAIVQAVATAHGGKVSLETGSSGSTFTIELPLQSGRSLS